MATTQAVAMAVAVAAATIAPALNPQPPPPLRGWFQRDFHLMMIALTSDV